MKGVVNNTVKIDINIRDIDFVFTPLSLAVNNAPEGRSSDTYIFEIEKGCQLIQRVKQPLRLLAQTSTNFQQQQRIVLKIPHQKGSQHQLAMYHLENQQLQHIYSFPLNLSKVYEEYIAQINQHAQDYLFVEDRMNKKLTLGKSWKALKGELKRNRKIIKVSDPLELFTLKYSVEVVGEIDKYDDEHTEKTRVKSKSSKGSLLSFSSLSSKHKKEEPTLPSMEKIDAKINEDSKQIAQITKNITSKNESSVHFQKDILSPVLEEGVSPKQQLPLLPLNLLHQKKGDALSDIIERSNEGQSSMTGLDSDRKWKELSEIKESDNDDVFMRVKTQLILRGENSPRRQKQLRRNNSFDQEHSKKSPKSNLHVKFKEDYKEQDESEKECLQTSISVEQVTPKVKEIKNKKWMIAACIIGLLWLLMSLGGVFFFNQKRANPRGTAKNVRLKKHRIGSR